MIKLFQILILTCCLVTSVHAEMMSHVPIKKKLQIAAENYLKKYQDKEHISEVALSVSSEAFSNIMSVYAGTTEFSGTTPIDHASLYQIGSLTKAFTAAILLQLEADKRYHFNIEDPIRKYLPEYPKWGNVTVKQLLNMTSHIPSYTSDDTFLHDYVMNPSRKLTAQEMVAYVYEKPLSKKDWEYSNTNYILAGMIISRLTGQSVEDEMNKRFFATNNSSRLKLSSSYYISHLIPKKIAARLTHGYFYDPYSTDILPLATDITFNSLSWAGPAGAIVSDSEDIIHWVKALFTTNQVLPPKQLQELTAIVSEKTGKPLPKPHKDDPDGYGLGISVSYEEPLIVYDYMGSTFGYRALYMYFPEEKLIISVAVNSHVCMSNDEKDNNHLAELIRDIYEIVKKPGKKPLHFFIPRKIRQLTT